MFLALPMALQIYQLNHNEPFCLLFWYELIIISNKIPLVHVNIKSDCFKWAAPDIMGCMNYRYVSIDSYSWLQPCTACFSQIEFSLYGELRHRIGIFAVLKNVC